MTLKLNDIIVSSPNLCYIVVHPVNGFDIGRIMRAHPISPLKLACDKLSSAIPLTREEYSLILEALNDEYSFRREEWKHARNAEDMYQDLINDSA